MTWFGVRDQGAVGDGITLATAAVQAVIDCSRGGWRHRARPSGRDLPGRPGRDLRRVAGVVIRDCEVALSNPMGSDA